jgi:hypothetical protein
VPSAPDRCHVDVVYNHLVSNNLLNEFGGFTTAEIPRGIYFFDGDRADTGFGPRRTTVGGKSDNTLSTTPYCCSATTVSMDFGSTIRLIFALLANHGR